MPAATHRRRNEPYAGRIGEKPDAGFRHPTAARIRRTERASWSVAYQQGAKFVNCQQASYSVDRRRDYLVRGGGDLRRASYVLFRWAGRLDAGTLGRGPKR